MVTTVGEENTLNIEILLDAEALPHEVAAVEEVAQEEGLRAPVSASFFRNSLGDLPWVIFLLAPVSVFFSAFLTGVGQEAGRDAYQAVRRLVSQLYGARRDGQGGVAFWDSNTFTHVVLLPDLPEEAYGQLTQIGSEQLEGGYWVWDFEKKRWGPGKLDPSESTK